MNSKNYDWLNRDLNYCIEKFVKTFFDKKSECEPSSDSFKQLIYSFVENEDFVHAYPWTITWKFGSECNLRCEHCFYHDKPELYNGQNDLTTKEAIDLAKILTEEFGVMQVIFTGGEPFIRKDIFEVLKILKKKNIAIYIQTNGSLIDEKIANKLGQLFNPYLDVIQISLDGASSRTNNLIRNSDSFDKTKNAIKYLIANNIKVNVNCTLTKYNQYELPELYELCDSLNVNSLSFLKINPTCDNHKKLLPDEDVIFKVATKLYEMHEESNSKMQLIVELKKFFELLENNKTKKIIDKSKYINKNIKCANQNMCCHKHHKLFIKADGKVYLCYETGADEFILGDIRKNSLQDIWNKRFEKKLFQKRPIEKMWCSKCKYFSFCMGGCPANALLGSQDLFGPDGKCKFSQKLS